MSYIALTVDGTVPVLTKRSRKNKKQTSLLEWSFGVNLYPNKTTIKEQALQTGLSELQIQSWYANKRKNTGIIPSEETPSSCENLYMHLDKRSQVNISVINNAQVLAYFNLIDNKTG